MLCVTCALCVKASSNDGLDDFFEGASIKEAFLITIAFIEVSWRGGAYYD
ncbi:hypothetical protein GCM10008968_14730 [Bacillus horti]